MHPLHLGDALFVGDFAASQPLGPSLAFEWGPIGNRPMGTPPYKLVARDDTGRLVEVFCATCDKAFDEAADFRMRGYLDVFVYDADGREVQETGFQT